MSEKSKKETPAVGRKWPLCVFVAACLLSLPAYALGGNPSEWKLRVTIEKAGILSEPDIKGRIVAFVARGTILESYEKAGDWFRVILWPDASGFIAVGYILSKNVDVLEHNPSTEFDFWKEEAVYFRGIGLTFKFAGGLDYFSGGDITKGTRGMYDSAAETLSAMGYIAQKNLEFFSSGYDLSADAIYDFSDRLGLGLGMSLIRFSETNTANDFSAPGVLAADLQSKPDINIVQIRLGLYYRILFYRLLSIVLNGGPSLYLTEYSYGMTSTIAGLWRDKVNQSANATTIGFYGGFELEARISPKAALFLECQGKYARISGLKGTEIRELWENGLTTDVNTTGTLYYIEGGAHPKLSFLNAAPSGSGNARQAVFDFSGVCVRAGFKIRF
jgi:hypothetical protein